MSLFGRRDPERYKRRVHAGLDRAYRDAEVEDAQLETLKVIVLSDQHKGTRDGADDFQRGERYERFWGNHDDLWREPGQVAKHLGGQFEGLAVRETLRVRVMRGA